MRDLINIIDQVALLEAHHKENRAALAQKLRDLFAAFGYTRNNIGIGVNIDRKLWKNGKIYYKITIYLNYDNYLIADDVIAKIRFAKGKYIERGLSKRIQKIITEYIPDWQFSRYDTFAGDQEITIVGSVDVSEHLSV